LATGGNHEASVEVGEVDCQRLLEYQSCLMVVTFTMVVESGGGEAGLDFKVKEKT